MTRLTLQPTIITVHCSKTLEPRYITWNRQRFAVDQIVDIWRVDADWWSGKPVSRHYVSLISKEGAMLIIYFDFYTKHWCLEQAYD